MNLKTGKWKEKQLDNLAAEYPIVNENFLGRKIRYGYLSKVVIEREYSFDGIIKYDFKQGKSEIHQFSSGRYNGAAAFAPRKEATVEDDGWLLTFVSDENTETSELLILNAQDITSEPVARILIPQRVPYGFHCNWITEEQLLQK